MSISERSTQSQATSDGLVPAYAPGAAGQRPAWMSPEQGFFTRARRTLRNRWWVILLFAALGTGAGIALSTTYDDEFTARATLLAAQPEPTGAVEQPEVSALNRERAINTQERLLELPRVAARAVATAPGGATRDEIAEAVDLEASEGADTLDVVATSSSAERAAGIANAYATVASTLSERLGGTRVEVVQPALGSEQTGSSPLVRNGALGLLAGLLVGFLVAGILDKLDRRLTSVEELEEIYELPILSRIPRSRSLGKRSQRRVDGEMLTTASGFSEEAEAFRILRANLRYFNVDRRVSSILVVSPLSGDGKSTIARFLAITMASMGDRVALVDADLRKEDPTAPSSQLRAEGLSLVLAGFDLDEALTEMPVAFDPVTQESRSLARLPSGPLPPNPSELLESERMRWVISELEQRFDVVIVDSPALVTVSDALALVPAVSGVMIVSGLGQTTRNAALDLRRQLALLGGRPLGVVGNFWTASGDSYYYGYHRAGAHD